MPADDDATPDPEPPSRRPASRLLADFSEQWTGDRVRLRDVVDVLEDRAFGLLILIFSAPNIIPSPIPGISGILGIPLVLVAAQLALGFPHPWFPRIFGDRSMATSDFRALMAKIIPWLHRVERLTRPRLRWLSQPRAERLLAVACLILSVVLALPIPLGNMLPALAISLIAIGLIEHDGIVISAGLGIGVVSLVIVSAVVLALIKAAVLFLHHTL